MKQIYSEKELISMTGSQSEILIYGCGAVGRKTWSYLKHNGVEAVCFAVTDKAGNDEVIDGLEVQVIDDLQVFKEALIIIATMENSHEAIAKTLKERGFNNIASMMNEAYTTLCREEQRRNPKLIFQIHVTEHCDLNCRGCYHFSPLAEEEYLDLKVYEADLKRLSQLFDGEMEEILLLGGEPLHHPEMAEILRLTRLHFPVGTIKILSNGLPLAKMPEEFWKACRETKTQLWLTKYPIALDHDKLESLSREKGCDLQYFNTEPVRTLGHQPLDIEGKQDWKKNFHSCYRKNTCIFLEKGRLYTCIIPGCIRHFNKYFNTDIEVCEEDYVDIYKVKTKEELLDGLLKPIPFCKYCDRSDVTVFGEIPWQQTKYKMEEWTR